MNEKSTSLILANRIFDWDMIRDKALRLTELQELVPAVLASKKFYLVADNDTTEPDWVSREFGVFIAKQELLVFLDQSDAVAFAEQNHRILPNDGNKPMITCISYHSLSRIVITYQAKKLIRKVKIFARRPLFVVCPANYFEDHREQEPLSLMTAPSLNSGAEISYPDKEFLMVEDVKKVLDLSEVSKRRAIDPGLICENLHSVIEKLIHFNRIDMHEMEETLKLPPGMLGVFCKDRVGSAVSKETAMKLLRYFGLQEYLYQFKRYCNELMTELNADETLDLYEIKPSTFRTEEKFKLTDIRRCNDQRNKAYIYELTLESKTRAVTLMVSTPLNYVVGKTYEIVGLDVNDHQDEKLPELKDEEQSEKAAQEKSKKKAYSPIPQNKVQHMTADPEDLEGGGSHARPTRHNPGSYQPAAGPKQPKPGERRLNAGKAQDGAGKPRRPQTEMDRDQIIRFLKESYGDNLPAAEAKIKAMEPHEDIIHAFAHYISSHRPGRLKEFDYTPGLLMAELHYNAYDAYLMMAKLRNDPKQTKQELVYRKTDPQYQKAVQTKKEG